MNTTCRIFPGRLLRYTFINSVHLNNVEDCLFAKKTYMITLVASVAHVLISVSELLVGFSGDKNCNLFRKSDLSFKRIYSFSPLIEYCWLVGHAITKRDQIFSANFFFPKADNVSPYDLFTSLVVVNNYFFS